MNIFKKAYRALFPIENNIKQPTEDVSHDHLGDTIYIKPEDALKAIITLDASCITHFHVITRVYGNTRQGTVTCIGYKIIQRLIE